MNLAAIVVLFNQNSIIIFFFAEKWNCIRNWNLKQQTKNNINSIGTTRCFLFLSQTVLLKCKQFVRYFKSQFIRNNFSFNSNWIPVTEQFNFINIWLFIRSKNLTTFCLTIWFDWFSYSWLLWLFRVGVKLLSMRFYCLAVVHCTSIQFAQQFLTNKASLDLLCSWKIGVPLTHSFTHKYTANHMRKKINEMELHGHRKRFNRYISMG